MTVISQKTGFPATVLFAAILGTVSGKKRAQKIDLEHGKLPSWFNTTKVI